MWRRDETWRWMEWVESQLREGKRDEQRHSVGVDLSEAGRSGHVRGAKEACQHARNLERRMEAVVDAVGETDREAGRRVQKSALRRGLSADWKSEQAMTGQVDRREQNRLARASDAGSCRCELQGANDGSR